MRLYLAAHGYDQLPANPFFFHTRLPHTTVNWTPSTLRLESHTVHLNGGYANDPYNRQLESTRRQWQWNERNEPICFTHTRVMSLPSKPCFRPLWKVRRNYHNRGISSTFQEYPSFAIPLRSPPTAASIPGVAQTGRPARRPPRRDYRADALTPPPRPPKDNRSAPMTKTGTTT